MITVLFALSVFLIVFFMMSVGLFLAGKPIQGGDCAQKSCACFSNICEAKKDQ